MPNKAKAREPITARKMPFWAAFWASFWLCSPRERESRALTPTQVPEETAIIRLWIGKARDTALRAYSLTLDTKMLSTILYSACNSMDIIIGRDMDRSSLFTDMTPILFSAFFSFCICISSLYQSADHYTSSRRI